MNYIQSVSLFCHSTGVAYKDARQAIDYKFGAGVTFISCHELGTAIREFYQAFALKALQ